MRDVQELESACFEIDKDLKLVRLASPKPYSEPSEECFFELSRALQEALEVIERSLHN